MPEVDAESILALEERALNGWPALQTALIDGWALRFAEGCTKRANSASAIAPRGLFSKVRHEAERLYAQARLPATFRISPLAPAETDTTLAAAGYTLADPSLVMIAELSPAAGLGLADAPAITLTEHPDSIWLEGVANANGIAPTLRHAHTAIIGALRNRAAFATLRLRGEPIGFGMAVEERGQIGLFDLVIAPQQRGNGYGRALCLALLGWGQERGAQGAYLQVREDNQTARALYASLGFRAAYAYHYRIAPAAEIA